MFQRIQTVYLFLVFVFAILFVMLPLANLVPEDPYMSLQLSKYSVFFDAFEGITGRWMAFLLVVLFFTVMLITVLTSFYYKRRLLQIKLGKFNMLVHAAMILVSFFMIDHISKQLPDYTVTYGPGIFFPIASLIFILLANRAIRKDENLVRAADRFR